MNNIKKILIVDDDQDLCDLIAESLKINGLECCTAYSAEEALSILKKNHYALILIDYHIDTVPVDRFIEALSPELHEIPYIIMTGYASSRSASIAKKQGAVDFIIKDNSFFHSLLARVEKTLKKQ